jgi:hypothetical protein
MLKIGQRCYWTVTVTNLGLSLSWGEWTVTLGHTRPAASRCVVRSKIVRLIDF